MEYKKDEIMSKISYQPSFLNWIFLITVSSFLIISAFYTLYSYSQIDLNLTLSSNSVYQYYQNILIAVGYFNRPLSAVIFVVISILLTTLYLLIQALVRSISINPKVLFGLILLISLILLFSYTAFSHDQFNYMFDARILVTYGKNPYQFKAGDFPQDLWVRFMHWTHRTYPYGPVWLSVTVPVTLLGFGKFVPTLFLYKIMFICFYLGNCYLIYKILEHVKPKYKIEGTIFYAFNPLVITESLMSPHNESIMLFFLLASFYFMFVRKNTWLTYLLIVLSAGIKFVTGIIIPVFIAKQVIKKPFFTFNRVTIISSLLMIITLVVEIIYREPYPWYFIPILGLFALIPEYVTLRWISGLMSFFVLMQYAPYLYYGDYLPIVSQLKTAIFYIPLCIFALIFGFTTIMSYHRNHQINTFKSG
jgi:hypothetical protein